MKAKEIIAELQRVAGMLNSNTVSVSQFSRHGRITMGRVLRAFGRWNDALEAAGLEPTTKYRAIPRKEVIVELQRVAQLLDQPTLSRSEFLLHGTLSPQVAERIFGTWSAAVKAAGLTPLPQATKIPEEELEAEFMRVYDQLGGVPTHYEFAAAARFSPETYRKRWGSWRKTVAHYLGPEAAALSESRVQTTAPPLARGASPRRPRRLRPVDTPKGSRVFGAPLNFRALRNQPTNEQEVVFLFGIVAGDLGFLVESVRAEFPDCVARRRTKRGYVDVVIEFELKSSNFRDHGHDPAECGLVVCWEDDWPECPVEVLELRSALRQLDSHD